MVSSVFSVCRVHSRGNVLFFAKRPATTYPAGDESPTPLRLRPRLRPPRPPCRLRKRRRRHHERRHHEWRHHERGHRRRNFPGESGVWRRPGEPHLRDRPQVRPAVDEPEGPDLHAERAEGLRRKLHPRRQRLLRPDGLQPGRLHVELRPFRERRGVHRRVCLLRDRRRKLPQELQLKELSQAS